jgi:hypothetical protein
VNDVLFVLFVEKRFDALVSGPVPHQTSALAKSFG